MDDYIAERLTRSTAARMDVRHRRDVKERNTSPLTQQGIATPDSLGNEMGRPQSATLQSDMNVRVVPSDAGTVEQAGTQARPVEPRMITSDLPPLKTSMTAEEYAGMHVEMITTYDVMKDGSVIRTDHQSVAEAIAKVSRGRGRPRTITDMKAYKAQKERERRARLKEGK